MKTLILVFLFLFIPSSLLAQDYQTRLIQAKQSLAHLDYDLVQAKINALESDPGVASELELLFTESFPVETRAIWLDDIHMAQTIRTREDVAQYLDLLHALNFNVILLDVYGDGKTIYPSQVAPQHDLYRLRFQEEDLFQVYIEEAHKRGLEIHAWLRIFCLGNGVEAFLDRIHWLERDIRGGFSNEYYLSPASPEAREYLISLIRGIAGYEVHGIHLDTIRYGENHGYSFFARDLYETLFGIDPVQIRHPSDARSYKAFKAQFVSSFVDRAGQEARAIRPDLLISAAVAPPISWGKDSRGQDWEHWVRNRMVHFLMPMDYVPTAREYSDLLDLDLKTIHFQAHDFPGISLYAFGPDVMVEQWTVGRSKPITGQTFFSSLHLQTPQQEALKGIFRQPAIPTLRNPVQASLVISENLRGRLGRFGPELDLDPVVFMEIMDRLQAFEVSLTQAPIRPWDTRDLRAEDPAEAAALTQLLAQLHEVQGLTQTLPQLTREGILRDLEQIRSLLRPLLYTSQPYQYQAITD